MIKLKFMLRWSIIDRRAEDNNILLTKTNAAGNEVALSYHRVRGLYFLGVVFTATIVLKDVFTDIP